MTKRKLVRKMKETKAVTLTEAHEAFMREKEQSDISIATIKNYQLSFDVFMRENDFDKTTLTDDDRLEDCLGEWKFYMREEKQLSDSSVNHYMRDIRAFFYWCMDNELMESFNIVIKKERELPLKLYTDEQLEKLLVKPRGKKEDSYTEWRTWAIVAWVLATGNRCKTICNVRMDNIDLRAREIVLEHTKNRKTQVLPISTALYSIIREFIDEWRDEAEQDEFLFCNISGEQMTESALKQSYAKYCRDRGVDRTSIHSLRHNFAKGYIKAGGNELVLQELLGHSSLEMTKRYVKLFKEDLKRDIDRYSTLDNIHKPTSRTKRMTRRGGR